MSMRVSVKIGTTENGPSTVVIGIGVDAWVSSHRIEGEGNEINRQKMRVVEMGVVEVLIVHARAVKAKGSRGKTYV